MNESKTISMDGRVDLLLHIQNELVNAIKQNKILDNNSNKYS